MNEFDPIGFEQLPASPRAVTQHEIDSRRIALARVLEFTRHTIDEVISDPIVRNEVLGFYLLYRFIERYCESYPQGAHNGNDRYGTGQS